jgi:hypothetical protein
MKRLVVALVLASLAAPVQAQVGSGTVEFRFTSFFGPARLSNSGVPAFTGTVNGATPDFGPPGSSFDTGRGNGSTYDTGLIGATLSGGTFPLTGTPTSEVSLLDGFSTVGSPGENILRWTPAAFTNVAIGQQFTLGTLTFQNGGWYGGGANGAANVPTRLGLRVNTISGSGAVFNQQRNLTLIMTVNAPFPNDLTTLPGQEAEADWVTIFDNDSGRTLNSFRVFDVGAAPPGVGSIGTVDLIGRFGSLIIDGFANPTGGFLTVSDLPLPPVIPPGGGGGGGGPPAIPEPASWAMLIAGFGLTGAVLRRRRALAAA